MLCRVCHAAIKRAGTICEDCGLIAHHQCASHAAPRCDSQEQVALMARQQEHLAIGYPHPPPPISRHDGLLWPQTSHERMRSPSPTAAAFAALPGRLFHGIKRTKGTHSSLSIDIATGQYRSDNARSSAPHRHSQNSVLSQDKRSEDPLEPTTSGIRSPGLSQSKNECALQ
jgi:hypothetical protein